MKVIPVYCLPQRSDNYAYVVIDSKNQGAVVDPVEADKVLSAVEQNGVDVKGVLTDHQGGNASFLKHKPGITVWGGDDRITTLSEKVVDKKPFPVGSLKVTPFYTLGHTNGSVSYFVEDSETNEKAVFTGDTLFIGGCGRLFEGTPEQMYNSLVKTLGQLPKETKVYCGHEYTKTNLKFAQQIEPSNSAISQKLAWAETTQVTVPSTIEEELSFNPFLRVDQPSVQKAVGGQDPIEVLAKLREMKNAFKL
ncbi:hypothetical protein HK104_003225 [Borealophlyctis nickersoniae]|nr:hypothetical protein HK104_003225 [Borealophlyctis nickersoniae]